MYYDIRKVIRINAFTPMVITSLAFLLSACGATETIDTSGTDTDADAPVVIITTPGSAADISDSIAVAATASDNVAVIGVQFKLDGIDIEVEDTSSPYTITWNSLGIPNGTHILTAVARDAVGNESTSDGVTINVNNVPSVDNSAPSVPSGLSTNVISSSKINLSWNSSTDDIGVVGYKINRDGTLIATVTSGTTFQDTGLSANTTYAYKVQAYDAAGNYSSFSTNTIGTTLANNPPPGGDALSIPSFEDEKSTYIAWGWTWTLDQEPSFPADPAYSVTSPDIHYDTEGDDLWTYLMMYIRTGEQGYYDRASAWADYFKNRYVTSPEFAFDEGFLLDHVYGWGLVSWYEYTGDTAALAAAESIAAKVEAYWNQTRSDGTPRFVPGNHGMAFYGVRQGARHLLLATRVAEATAKQRWINLRDKLIELWLQSPDWDPRGIYYRGNETDYPSGVRQQASFQIGLLTEAFAHAYRTTGRTELKDRIVTMAWFIDQYGLDPTYQYTGKRFGVLNGEAWHVYSNTQPVTFWDPVYTISLVNTLVRGYIYTGDRQLYNQAKYFFNRGTKGKYGEPVLRTAADNEVHHFVDTVFSSSSGNFYLGYNKGELQYTYLLFDPSFN